MTVGAHRDGMRGTLPGRQKGLLALIAVLGLGTALAWPTLISGPREKSLVPSLTEPQAVAAAIGKLSDAEKAALRARETGALAAEPLDSDALRNMAVLDLLAKPDMPNGKLAAEAAARSVHDRSAHLVVADQLLKAGEFEQGLAHLDIAARAEPDKAKELFPALAALAARPEVAPALAKLLKTQPPWRAEFLGHLFTTDTSGHVGYNLLAEMRKAGSVIYPGEVRVLIDQRVKSNDFDGAYFLWLDFLSTSQLAHALPVYDGSFDFEPENQFFGWNFYKTSNTDMAIVPKNSSVTERMLRLRFVNRTDKFSNIVQHLRLDAGDYTLMFAQKAAGLVTSGGLTWRLRCYGTSTILAESAALRADTDWQKISTGFKVPDTGCPVQMLALESQNDVALDHKISGEVDYTGFAITPNAAAAP